MTADDIADAVEIECHGRGYDLEGSPQFGLYSQWCEAVGYWGADSPAARGCLLDVARAAWGDAVLFARHRRWDHEKGPWVIVTKTGPCSCGGGHWYGASEFEALVAALEAAPQREAAPARMSDLADPGPPHPAWVELVLPSKVGGS